MREIRFADSVRKDLQKIPSQDRHRILKKITHFASLENPRETAKPMINYRFGTWRRRIGDWRVIFDIDDQDRIIIVLIIGHRKKIYD